MKVIFTPPDLILVFVILQIIAHFLFPIKQIIPNFWLYLYFRKRKTTTKIYETPNKLVTSGLFRFSRNPNYLGMAITLFGVSILTGSLVTFIFPFLFIILTEIFVIPTEERTLEKKFGKRYLEYKKQVRRWL